MRGWNRSKKKKTGNIFLRLLWLCININSIRYPFSSMHFDYTTTTTTNKEQQNWFSIVRFYFLLLFCSKFNLISYFPLHYISFYFTYTYFYSVLFSVRRMYSFFHAGFIFLAFVIFWIKIVLHNAYTTLVLWIKASTHSIYRLQSLFSLNNIIYLAFISPFTIIIIIIIKC